MKKLFKNNPQKFVFWSLFGFVILLTATAVGLILLNRKNEDPNVLAMFGNETITQEDLDGKIRDRYVGIDINLDEISSKEKKEVLNKIIEEKILKEEQIKAKITVTDEEAISLARERSEEYDTFSDEKKATVIEALKKEILQQKIDDQLTFWVEGRYLLVRFDKYTDRLSETATPTEIAAHKDYALKLAQDVSSKLRGGTITYEEAIKMIVDDSVVGSKAYIEMKPNYYGAYTREDLREGISYLDTTSYSGFKELVLSQSDKTYSEPALVKQTQAAGGKELFYAITQNTGFGATNTNKDYETWLSEKKVEYNVVILDKQYADVSTGTNSLIQQAKAAPVGTAKTCGVSNTHKTNFRIHTYKQNADLTLSNYEDVRSGLVTGGDSATTHEGLTNLTLGCEHNFYGHATGNNGNDITDAAGVWNTGTMHYVGTDIKDRAVQIICDEDPGHNTGYVYMFVDATPPAIEGSVTSAGHWEYKGLYGSISTSKEVGGTLSLATTTNTPNGLKDTWDRLGFFLEDNLGNGSNWANGTSVTAAVTWKPHWNVAPTPRLVSPAVNAEQPLSETQTTRTVSLVADAWDDNGDDTAVQVVYRKIGAPEWKSFGYTIDNNTPNNVGSSPLYNNTDIPDIYSAYGWRPTNTNHESNVYTARGNDYTFTTEPISVGAYEWTARGKDEHGWFSNWLPPRQFNVTPPVVIPTPTLSCSASPNSGLAPLAVAITPTVSPSGSIPSPSLNYDVDYNGTTVTNDYTGKSLTTIYHIYESSGAYTVRVEDVSGSGKFGICSVTVKDPTGGGGGEVSP